MSTFYRFRDFPVTPFSIDQFMFTHTVVRLEDGNYRVRGQLHFDWWVDAYFEDLNGYATDLKQLDLNTLKNESAEALKQLNVEFDLLTKNTELQDVDRVNACRSILFELNRNVTHLDGDMRVEQQAFHYQVIEYLSEYFNPSTDE